MDLDRFGARARRFFKVIGAGLASLACLAPCLEATAAAQSDPRAAAVHAGPGSRATRTVTSFADAMVCMDDLFLQYGKSDIGIISDGIPDATETIKLGARDIVISTLDTMSLKSGAFRFVDLDTADTNVASMQQLLRGSQATAEYYIKGSISQVDQEVMADSKRAGIAIKQFSAGRSKDRLVSNISLELGVYNVRTRTLVRGVRAQNTIQLVRSGSGTDMEGLLPFASLVYEVKQDRSQGTHQTVRTLIELSMIELLGKFTKVPYWRCLALPSADPAARRAALEYFQAMKPAERLAAAQSALNAAKYYEGESDGVASPLLSDAVARYRVATNLAAGPDVDFELYFNFLTHGLVANPEVKSGSGRRITAPLLAERPAETGLTFELIAKTRDDSGVAIQGDAFRLFLKPNKDAFFYCFMGGEREKTAYRIYPNRFTGSQPRTMAGDTLAIPAEGQQFSIKLNDIGREQVACIARETRYEEPVPGSLTGRDLEDPIQSKGALSGVAAVVNEHQKRDAQGLRSSVRVVTVDVVPRSAP